MLLMIILTRGNLRSQVFLVQRTRERPSNLSFIALAIMRLVLVIRFVKLQSVE